MFDVIHTALCRLGDGAVIEVRVGRIQPSAPLPASSDSRILSTEQWQRAGRFSDPRTARQFLGSHLLLNGALRDALGDGFDPGEIVPDRMGKPFLPGHPIHFSLSRSGDYAAVGLCRSRAVGVDIETRVNAATARDVAPRVLHPDELASWTALPDAALVGAFTRYWCLKEAVLKARGEGLSRDPREIRVAAIEGQHQLQALPDSYGTISRWETGCVRAATDWPAVYWAACPQVTGDPAPAPSTRQ